MITQLESLGDKQLAVGDQLDTADLLTWPEEGAGGEQLYDPHIWNSPELWTEVVDLIGDKLSEVDADNADTYAANADSYGDEIDAAAKEASAVLEGVSTRTLITGMMPSITLARPLTLRCTQRTLSAPKQPSRHKRYPS